jgi:hypothetical protein
MSFLLKEWWIGIAIPVPTAMRLDFSSESVDFPQFADHASMEKSAWPMSFWIW